MDYLYMYMYMPLTKAQAVRICIMHMYMRLLLCMTPHKIQFRCVMYIMHDCICSYSDTWDRLIVCAALLGRIYKGGYERMQGELMQCWNIYVSITVCGNVFHSVNVSDDHYREYV